MYKNMKKGLGFRLLFSTRNVILRRERSELSGESRNFMAILLNTVNSIVSHFLNVINGLVPLILVQQVTNLVNKFALLFKRSMFNQDCRNRLCVMSGNDSKRRMLNTYCKFFKQMYHPGSSANELTLKAKDNYKSVLQLGRSMIEMLGVLAIIAVLSVGGIAGYSKAMLMWHSNKQKDLLTELINNAITLKPNLSSIRNTDSVIITDIFAAMGAIPEGFTYKNNII